MAALRKLGPEAMRCVAAVVRFRSNPVSAVCRYWTLYRNRRFSPDEIHFFRLLDPGLTEEQLAQLVSKEELTALQRRLNPPKLHPLTEDKLRFHQHCRAMGLPVPEIYALYDPTGPSSERFPQLRNHEALARFLSKLSADSLVLKPVTGVHGDGVMRLSRRADAWRNHEDVVVTARDIARQMERSSYARWMLQELVTGHPDLCALSATQALQTIRVVTLVNESGATEILAARLRLACTAAPSDNFNYGTMGNVITILDVADGTIRSAVGASRSRREICAVTRHPRTGKELIGYRVPGWHGVQKLAHEAAKAFMPLRTIGWDIAVTPREPRLIEGNVTWDTLSGEPRMGEIYRLLSAVATAAPGRRILS
jgi:hypothetical protein